MYQNTRGGQVALRSVLMPVMDFADPEKGDALSAIETALSLEKLNYEKLLNVWKVAEEANDARMCDFIESEFLADQVASVKSTADMVTELRRVGPGLGTYVWDRKLQESMQL